MEHSWNNKEMGRSFPASLVAIIIFCTITRNLVCYGQTNDIRCSTNDREALLDFKNGLNDPEDILSSWRGLSCCQWRGIGCDNITGAVTIIDLHPYPVGFDVSTVYPRYEFRNLSGEISPSLMKLESLTHFDLSFNQFEDIPIPEFIGSLKNLRYLNLSNAGFIGTIPHTLGNLSNLQYLDVSSRIFSLAVDNLDWITGLVSLKHLEMNDVDLSLGNRNWLEILNQLPQLTELHLSNCGLSGLISSLSYVNLTSLAAIDLSFNSFSSNFPDWLGNVSRLVYVDLSNCMLRGRIPLGLGSLPRLRFLNLMLNRNLSASAFSLFKGSWNRIEVLDLSANKIHGKIPSSIGNMSFLTDFSLSNNNLGGGIPNTIGSLCELETFDVSGNQMTGTVPDLLVGTENCGSDHSPLPRLVSLSLSNNKLTGLLPDWLGGLRSLKELSLSYNLFEGSLPDSLGGLQNLTGLNVVGNRLNGSLPENIGQLSKLTTLDVSSNSMTGIVSEVHFSKLSAIKILRLSSNSFILNVSSTWLPPFQIRNLDIGSSRLGPSFPKWLKTQNEIMFLDISNSSISDPIPNWFWDLSFNLSLINISLNQIPGRLPNSFRVTPFADIDFSSNLFEGPIPLPSVEIELFDLSNNRFEGSIPQNIGEVMPNLIFFSLSGNRLNGTIPASIGSMSLLQVLDLSGNHLTGNIPSGIGNCSYLKALDLGNNNISGAIPDSLGQLSQLQSLHLNDNLIAGKLPSSFKNLSSLETLDLGRNKFQGPFPLWLGEGDFTSLRILNLRSNSFSGRIEGELLNLSLLQVLDLAGNNFTGQIPTSWRSLRAMGPERMTNDYLLYGKYRGVYYEESLVVNVKNRFQKFTKTLSLVTSIDLSENNLSGEFPEELAELHGLMILNLSRNHISGEIPESISRLRQMASLDLSNNDLSGRIPSEMDSLSFLGYLNLSNNNFSGKIPDGGQMSTFGAYAFEGNPGLCGAPLSVSCPGEDSSKRNNKSLSDESNDPVIDNWFYLSLGLGYAAGLLVPILILSLRRPLREKYFDFLDKIERKLPLVERRP